LIEGFSLMRDFFEEGGKVYDLFESRSRSELSLEWLVTGILDIRIETREIRGRAALVYSTDPHWTAKAPRVELTKDVNILIERYELYNSTFSHIVF
ncbi:MAG: hypothetical protein ACPL3C_12395, partial [Pyrobaculum sp.]